MTIEIVLGLPHLANGPLLARAAALRAPVLISANCLSRWRKGDGWRQWSGWRTGTLAHARGLASLDLDSAGYTMMVRYRGLPWSIADYMTLAASYPFRRISSVDYCCEHEVAHDREEVLDRIARTAATNRECFARAGDLGIRQRFMPVIQGREPDDYARSLDSIDAIVLPGSVIGVGSMCRRPTHGPQGLIAVVERLTHILPIGTKAHLFGVKGDALPYLAPFARWIASIDSQGWGIAARRHALRHRISKTDRLAADFMERWYRTQCERLLEPPRFVTEAADIPVRPPPLDPWEQAIAQARAEIRDLIETGELDHDAMTDAWVEGWAADIWHSRRPETSRYAA